MSFRKLVRQIINEAELSEIDDEYAERFAGANTGLQLSYFNKMFGGESGNRVAIPFETNSKDQKKIEEFLNARGYSVDFEEGTAIERVETKQGVRERKVRLNKAIQKEVGKIGSSMQKNFAKTYPKTFKYFNSPSYKEAYNKGKDRGRQSVPPTSKPSDAIIALEGDRLWGDIRDDPNFQKAWIESGESSEPASMEYYGEYSSNYNEHKDISIVANNFLKEGSGYSIIISRDPLDVLRMSDFRNIQSCHSQGGSYFQCAVQEAEDGGAVAYLVKTEDLKDVNLNDEEVFVDSDRGMKGISPISRIRLRRFDNTETGEEVIMPELRAYGQSVPGFVDAVSTWSFENQKSLFYNDDGELELPDMYNFTRAGGSYSDTGAGNVFNNFFDTNKYRGDVSGTDEPEDPDDQTEEWRGEIEDSLERHQSDWDHIGVHADVENDGDGPYILASAELEVKIPELSKEAMMDLQTHSSLTALRRDLDDSMENSNYLPGFDDINIEDQGKMILTIDMSEIYDADDFDNTISSFHYYEEDYGNIVMAVRQFFIKKGYIQPNKLDYFLQSNLDDTDMFEEGEDPFDHIIASYDGEDKAFEFEGSYDVDISPYSVGQGNDFRLIEGDFEESFGKYLESIVQKDKQYDISDFTIKFRAAGIVDLTVEFKIAIDAKNFNRKDVDHLINTIELVDDNWDKIIKMSRASIMKNLAKTGLLFDPHGKKVDTNFSAVE